MKEALLILLLLLTLPAIAVRADDDDDGPADVPAAADAPADEQPGAPPDDEQALVVEVVSVQAPAQWMNPAAPQAEWQDLAAGQKLSENTILRTGYGAEVVLRFADRGEMIVRSSTKIGIAEFRRQAQAVRTRLGLKYGSVHAAVDPTAGPNDWQVQTATSTLSVGGSISDFASLVDSGTRVEAIDGAWFMTYSPLIQMLLTAQETGGGDIPQPYWRVLQRIQTLQMLDPHGGLTQNEQGFVDQHGGGLGLNQVGSNNSNGTKFFGEQGAPRGISDDHVDGSGGSGRDEGTP